MSLVMHNACGARKLTKIIDNGETTRRTFKARYHIDTYIFLGKELI